MKKNQYIKQIDFAKEMGFTRQRVTWLIKNGTIQKNKDGLIDLEKAKKIIKSNREIYPKKSKLKPKTKPVPKKKTQKLKTYAEARTEHEIYKAQMAKLDYLKKKGELVDRRTRVSACQDIIVITKTKLLSMSTKLSPQLVGIGSIKKIKNMIDKEIYQALNELSRLEKIE